MTKLKQSAFYRGFLAGIVSPFTFLDSPHHRYHIDTEDLLDRFWREVGQAINEAIELEKQRDEQSI